MGVIFPDMIMYIHTLPRWLSVCVCVCVRASNKILCLSHTFEYAFWRFVYLRLPFLSSVFHTCFIPSICLPFTRARRTAEISDIVANKLIYYYSLLGIRHFWRLLSMYNGSYAWYACNWNLLWPAYRNYSSFACWIFTEIARMLRKYLTNLYIFIYFIFSYFINKQNDAFSAPKMQFKLEV